ncbi:aldo/keto reductase [Methanolobus sp.]|jgi:aryl-alcohol dehydrogenase-like predicted oxidoreductase|uniref:aldo/keto reductase n=1 Tax=Methanolobus sp. TaxID=1874737 RepID=UPI0025F869D6|nr:aldo/keto reductase [Methanolobus sp.]
MLISKITLGTAQFGMDYGINNQRGKIPKNEIFQIMDTCVSIGIKSFDTARNYGDSESLLGTYIKTSSHDIDIFSKLPECNPNEVDKIVHQSLKNLNIDTIYGYYIHSFKSFIDNPQIWGELEKLKAIGKIQKIGFSLYYPEELDKLIHNNVLFDVVQIPFNVLDQRFERYFSILKKKGIEISVRSVFLQGLLFKRPSDLSPSFLKIQSKLSDIQNLAKENDIPLEALFFNFATNNQYIDHVVVGVDNLQNLKDIVGSLKYSQQTRSLQKCLESFREDDENIILPFNWK